MKKILNPLVESSKVKALFLGIFLSASFMFQANAQTATHTEPGPLSLSPGVGEQVLFAPGELTGVRKSGLTFNLKNSNLKKLLT